MKKLLMSLGTIAAVVAPVAAVVSCGDKNPSTQGETPGAIPGITPVKGLDGDKNPSILKDIKEDGIYFDSSLLKGGKLWEGGQDGKVSEKNLAEVGKYNSYKEAIEISDGDSFYVAYDKDDSDGIKPEDFEKQFKFVDTSTASGAVEANKQLGNSIVKDGFNLFNVAAVTFANGHLNPFYGSQTNHLDQFKTIEEAFKAMKSKVPADVFAKQLAYYALKAQADGTIVHDDTITNGASTAFWPIVASEDFLTYKKVGDRTYKITVHVEDGYALSSAAFTFMNLATGKRNDLLGCFSFGNQDHAAYEKDPRRTFLVRDNKYIK